MRQVTDIIKQVGSGYKTGVYETYVSKITETILAFYNPDTKSFDSINQIKDDNSYDNSYYSDNHLNIEQGFAGILHYFSHYQAKHPLDTRISEITAQICNRIQAVGDGNNFRNKHSLFTGLAGTGHTLWKNGFICGDSRMVYKGENIVKNALTNLSDISDHSLYSGLAGSVFILADLYEKTGKAYFREQLLKAGNLLADAMEQEIHTTVNLHPHGNIYSGISAALYRLDTIIPSSRIRTLAKQMYIMDEEFFNPLDTISPTEAQGKNGNQLKVLTQLALSRLINYSTTENSKIHQTTILSMENLVQESNKILESSQQADISVKSGLSGTGIILILGSELTGRQKYYDHALRIADYIMEMNPFEPGRGTIKGMYYSNTRKEQSYMDPSLMTGLSGLGCFYHTLIYRDIDMAFLF